MTNMLKTLLRWLVLLVVVSMMMTVVQWLAAPEGYGASGWAEALPQLGHPRLGKALHWFNDSRGLRAANHVWQDIINAPRNTLLRDLRFVDTASRIDFYIYERGEYDESPTPREALLLTVRRALFFGLATVAVYLPLIIGVALIRRTTSRAMKEPVLIASLLFVIVGIGYLSLSNSDEQAKLSTILTALSLLTAAVGLFWSSLMTRRSRIIALAVLLIICSLVGMLSVTRGSGPRDPLSYPVFFALTFVLLIVEGGVFLLIVWLLLRTMERLRGGGAPPPSSLELKTAK
jgi:hypothetical protein